MNGKYILKNGEPVQCDSLLTWARWFETADDERRVRSDEIGDVRVSTVFLGLDHNYEEDRPPLLYETMIFGGEHDDYQERYSTRIEAEAGHIRAVALVKLREAGEG